MHVSTVILEPLTPSERILIAMRRRGLRGRDLALKVRMRPETLSRALRRDRGRFSPAMRRRIARALGYPPDVLFPEVDAECS